MATVTPSPDNTLVLAGSTAAITDANGNHWSITSGGQVAVNGVTDPTTARVIELAYEKGVIWQENASDLWWSKTLPTDTWGPNNGTPTSPVPASAGGGTGTGSSTVTPSPDNTLVLAGSTAAITDANGNHWSITSGGQVAVNGVTDPTTARVIELAYEKGVIWQENASDLWWSKTLPTDTWGPNNGTPTSPVPASAGGGTGTGSSAGNPAPVTIGSGNDSLVVTVNEDAYLGNAEFTVSVDGTQVGGIETTTALRSAGQTQAFTFKGNWGSGQHTASVDFINDAWGGTSTTDRNLYVTNITYDTIGSLSQPTALYTNGAVSFIVNASGGSTGTGSSTGGTGTGGNDVGGSAGQGGSLLPSGYLSTSGSQIVDSKGSPVRIDSIGWNGPDGLNNTLWGLGQVSYETILNQLKADGFNTVRIPWYDGILTASPAPGSINYSANPDLQGLNSMQVLQKVVAYAGQVGVKVIFDHHNDEGGVAGGGGTQQNGLWFDSGPGTDGTDGSGTTGTVTAAKFQQDWVTFANYWAGNSTVIGFDLSNEPNSLGGNGSVWGGGGPNDIHAMYQTVGDAIQAVDPGALIICEGPETDAHGLGYDLSGVTSLPVVLNTPNKLVYSVHEYPDEIGGNTQDSGTAYIQSMNQRWAFLVSDNIAPVFIGEMGASMTSANSQAWAATLLDYLNGKDGALGGPTFSGNQQPVSGSWWLAGNETGQNPDGIQTSWGGSYRPEQQAITNQMTYSPTTIASTY